jgi:hypothetical protein
MSAFKDLLFWIVCGLLLAGGIAVGNDATGLAAVLIVAGIGLEFARRIRIMVLDARALRQLNRQRRANTD